MIKPEDALLVFKKWRDEGTTIFCASLFRSCWVFNIRGRVASVENDDLVRLVSSDENVVFAFNLSGFEGFEYGEPEHAPEPLRSTVPLESRQTSFLLAAVPLRVPELLAPRDKFAFVEVTWETPE